MNIISVGAAGLALTIAGSAVAAERTSDADYIKANRCQALASTKTLGPQDTTTIDSFVKAEGRNRTSVVLTMAEDAKARAKREARSDDRRARLQAELSGPCVAYLQPAGASGQQ